MDEKEFQKWAEQFKIHKQSLICDDRGQAVDVFEYDMEAILKFLYHLKYVVDIAKSI